MPCTKLYTVVYTVLDVMTNVSYMVRNVRPVLGTLQVAPQTILDKTGIIIIIHTMTRGEPFLQKHLFEHFNGEKRRT